MKLFKTLVAIVFLVRLLSVYANNVTLAKRGSVAVIDQTHRDMYRVDISGDSACILFDLAEKKGNMSNYLDISEVFSNTLGPYTCFKSFKASSTPECHCSMDIKKYE